MCLRVGMQRMAERAPRWLLWRNVLSNYAYVGLMAVVTLFLTPVYVHSLGPAEWGAVALCITFQSVLFLLDAGLGQVAPREFASVHGDRHRQYALYHRFEMIYVRGALVTWVLGQASMAWVLPWVSPDMSDASVWAVRLALTQFALTFANSAPMGLWNGLQMQQRANLRQAGFLALKHAGALWCVTQLSAQAWAYVLPFVLVGVVETVVNVRTVHREYSREALALRQGHDAQAPSLRVLMSHLGGFGVAVLAGMLTSQLDRMVLASRLPLQDFGIYALAVTFGLAFMNLQQPLQKAFLPRIVASRGEARNLFWAVALVCGLPCLVVAWWSGEVLQLWLGARGSDPRMASVLALVLVGVAFNAMYAADYTRLVAANAWRAVLAINGLILLVQWTVLTWGLPALGMSAGGWSWVACGVLQFALGRWCVMKRGEARA